MRFYGCFGFAMVLLLGLPAWTASDGVDAPNEVRARAESRKLLEEVLMARLTRELALDEAQTVLLVRHLTEFRDRMLALRRERMERMRALRRAVKAGQDEAALQVLLDDVLANQRKTAEARQDVLDFDGFEMTTWQRARLLVFLNDFENDMRRLLRRAQERREASRPPRGGAPAPPPEEGPAESSEAPVSPEDSSPAS
jgi:hypothetical protein